MTRLAQRGSVYFWEEPVELAELSQARLARRTCPDSGVHVIVPQVPVGLSGERLDAALRTMLDRLIGHPSRLMLWYYTPMMLPFSEHLRAECIVYDCMDELANFRFAPPELLPLERRLMKRADLVFTGGYSLYDAKRDRHPRVYPFPSSVDREHFTQARAGCEEPADQRGLPSPRLGFYGVIDERMDLNLLAALAEARPDWSIVMVGPVVKIGPDELPRRANLHYLGGKSYAELPAYLGGWDAALMPFAINEATRFISPTKTPEYLAAGKPVVSTPIADVQRHYGAVEAVKIAAGPGDFIAACDQAIGLARSDGQWLREADELLSQGDWNVTFERMWALIEAVPHPRAQAAVQPGAAKARPTSGAARKHYDVMVVGAGFAGSVMAERIASQSGKRVLVVDRRPHVAGNAYDRLDAAGLLIHQYGPHIFHTNSADIFAYLSRFTEWRAYEHRVLARVNDKLLPIPVNRTTLNTLYGLRLRDETEAEAFLKARAEPLAEIRTSEDVVVSAVGRELYETFFRGYTRKQWGLDPSELDKSVTARVPTRSNTDDRYFTDRFQAMPAQGYTRMFERMLDHPGIDVRVGIDFEQAKQDFTCDRLVFTGPIDEYFGYRFGKLPYRSLRFEHETIDREWLQPVAVVNYPSEAVPYTRITEYKHLTGQSSVRTSITREYPADEGDPYYPIPRAECQALYQRYKDAARADGSAVFVGRLATYRYYNMDQIVGQALATFARAFADKAAVAPRSPSARALSAVAV